MATRPQRRLISPRTTLAFTFVTVALILLGGTCFSLRQEQMHVAASRAPAQTAGEEIEKEFSQLEHLYEKHLRQIVLDTQKMSDSAKITTECEKIQGVAQWSLIHGSGGTYRDVHLQVGFDTQAHWPQPTFGPARDDANAETLLLSRDDLLGPGGPSSGWVTDPGKPPVYWQRVDPTGDVVIVLLIDQPQLRAAVNTWLASWAMNLFTALNVRNGPICALMSSESVLLSTATPPPIQPDFVLPIRSFFGTWEISLWDPIVIRSHYDYRLLAVAGFLALLIAVIGILAYFQQRRLMTETANQVTFVNRVSHELRSPLTNILLNLELSQELLGEHEHMASTRLSLVQEEAQRLRRLVDNVLTFSSLERDQYRSQTRTCVPDQLIGAVIDQFSAAFMRRGLSVNFAGNANSPCIMDVDAVVQIFANLLSNIEKYVPPGRVEVSTNLTTSVFTLLVCDEGPGVPQSESEKIFLPFTRLERRVNEGASGAGLGLSIARELALGIGGSLRLVPGPAGAIFELHVPAFPSEESIS